MAHCYICNQDFRHKGELNHHINVNLKHGILERKELGLPLNQWQQSYLLDHYYEPEIKTCRVGYIPVCARNSEIFD